MNIRRLGRRSDALTIVPQLHYSSYLVIKLMGGKVKLNLLFHHDIFPAYVLYDVCRIALRGVQVVNPRQVRVES